MKSTTWRAVAIIGCCLLLAGCVPASGVKGMLALVAMVISVAAAAIGLRSDQDEDRLVRKCEDLDRKIDAHVRKYH